MTSGHSSTSPRLTSSQANRRQRFLLPALGIVILGLCGLTLLGLTHARVGAAALVVGAAAALLPLGPVIATFLWVDRWEPEPPRLLVAAFLWGACGATIAALLINDTAQIVGEVLLGTGGGDLVAALISAPLFEEAAKGLFVLAVLLRRRQEFNGIVDGIVYAGITGVGFAFTENITYFGLAFFQGGFGDMTGGVIAVFLLRGVLSPFTHSLFGAMLGIGLGIAASTSRPRLRVAAPLAGYLVAVLLHALWNGAATLGGGRIFINIYFLVMVPIFLSTALLVCWQRRREQHIVVTQLPGFAAEGWIAASEIGLLSSLTSRKEWRLAVGRRSGTSAGKAVAAYQLAVTELAFVRNQLASGRVVPGTAERLEQAVARLMRSRAAVLRSPGALEDSARSTAGIRRRNRPSRRPGRLLDRKTVLPRALARRPVCTEVTLPGMVLGSSRSVEETLPIPKMVLDLGTMGGGAPAVHDGVVVPVEPAPISANEPAMPAQPCEATDVTAVIDQVPPTNGEPKP